MNRDNSHHFLLFIQAYQIRTHVPPKHLNVTEDSVKFVGVYRLFKLLLSVDLRIVLVYDVDVGHLSFESSSCSIH